jgi:hypothetical protein
VGAHNRAKNLTTGIVRFAGGRAARVSQAHVHRVGHAARRFRDHRRGRPALRALAARTTSSSRRAWPTSSRTLPPAAKRFFTSRCRRTVQRASSSKSFTRARPMAG